MGPSSTRKSLSLQAEPVPPWPGQDPVSALQPSSDATCGETGGNGVRTGKEDKLFPVTGDMKIYLENLRGSRTEVPRTKEGVSKVNGYKSNCFSKC